MPPPTQPVRALLIEDSEEHATPLVEALKRGGYAPDWQRVETASGLRTALAEHEWDVVFCNHSMLGLDVTQALSILREKGDTLTALVVSGQGAEQVAVESMRLGGNDFNLKASLGSVVSATERERRVTDSLGARRAAEQALQASETCLQQSYDVQKSLLNTVPAHIILVSHEGTVLAVNGAWERFAAAEGVSLPDLGVGQSYLELCRRGLASDAEEVSQAAAGLQSILTGDRTEFGYEFTLHAPERHHCFALSITPLEGVQGRGAVVMHIDITERVKTESALRGSEERFRQMAENSTDVFWLTDPARREVLYVSPAYETVWGRSCESVYANATSVLENICLEDRPQVIEAFALPIHGSFNFTYRIVRPDGERRWIHHRGYPVKNAAGESYRLAGIATDVTEAHEAAQQIRDQASLLDHAQDAILVHDLEGRVQYWNKGAERVFGWRGIEALGRKVQEMLHQDGERYHGALEATLGRGSWTGEISKSTKCGGQVLVECRWTLMRDEAGQPKGILAINTDITERKKVEAQFFRAQRMESIGALAGGVAHDLNNVLAPILMAADVLRRRLTDPRDLDLVELIELSGQRGSDMVKQVLFFAGGVEARKAAHRPRELIREMEKIIRETFPKSIAIEVDAPAEMWSVFGDRTRLHQVLLNLCVNARDAMPRGGQLKMRACDREVDGPFAALHGNTCPGSYVMLEVADTGEGIPPEALARIFDPFFTTKEVGKGTGLGLSTTLAIVQSHGGFIHVESVCGQGTAFQVYLPAEMRPAEAPADLEATRIPRGNGELILIIDDEASIRSITGQTLEAYGYRVVLAGDGAEGLARYAEHEGEVAAVLTDMMMPLVDGAATMRVLLRINPALKIIAVSGAGSKTIQESADSAGAKFFLEKPYSAKTLLRTLGELFHPQPIAPRSGGSLRAEV